MRPSHPLDSTYPLYGLRCPASTSCLERHSHLTGRGSNSSSLYPPQARRFRKEKDAFYRRAELLQTKPGGFASSLKEGALGKEGKFPVLPRAPSPRGLAAEQTGGVKPDAAYPASVPTAPAG